MARISLVVCDLCKEIQETTPCSIKLATAGAKDSGDICQRCYDALLFKLKSTKKIEEAPKVKATAEVPKETKRQPKNDDVPVEVLPGEIKKVPSKFNKRSASYTENMAAARAAAKEMYGSCRHFFKTSDADGKIICANAPDGVTGELSTFKGCGKILNESDYGVTPPKHAVFK